MSTNQDITELCKAVVESHRVVISRMIQELEDRFPFHAPQTPQGSDTLNQNRGASGDAREVEPSRTSPNPA